jgi:serine/threonine protein kinase/tetratricopeptide (TPR) repeat protein
MIDFTAVESIFFAVLDKPPGPERAAFLKEACGDAVELRRHVERMLAAHPQAGSFLNAPAPALVATIDEPPITERPGTIIGPYKLKEQIGEGGMGLVFVAEQQQPVRRKVALKIIKPGMDSRQVIARFEAERQALALMDHQNIAKVFDAGMTESGRPYFVMELVHGVPITKFCDDNQLTPRQRLELFIPVCQAIQHAHQKGIIHRDVKPSNILVTMYDDRPVPKVIDFGVAKAIEQRLSENSVYTQFGTLVGTFEYMSPEQAEMNAFGVDTRSDIYSLGVLLYELLTGTTPLEKQRLRQAALDELVRLIREEEPPRPSARLSGSGNLRKIAAARKTEPARLSKLVRGEIDWIVMKCLEKDRTRRYETANGLARDVERYLHDEPVEACPPSAGYKLRKFARKHRAAFATAAGFAALLLLGTAVSTWLAVRATRAEREALAARDAVIQQRQETEEQRDRALTAESLASERLEQVTREKERVEKAEQKAAEEAAIAKAVNDFLQKDLLGQANVANQAGGEEGRDPDVKVRTLLDKTAKSIEGKFQDQPLTEAAIQLTLGRTYEALGRYAEAQPHLERSVRLRAAQLSADHLDTLSSKLQLGLVYQHQGKFDQAKTLLQEVLDGRAAQLGADHLDTLSSKYYLALLYMLKGEYDRAETLYKEVLDGRAAQLGADHHTTLGTKYGLAELYWLQKKFDRAESLSQEVLAAHLARLGADHPSTLSSKNQLAVVFSDQGKYDQAETLKKEVLDARTALHGANHRVTLHSKNNLAVLYSYQGKYDQAEQLHREVLEARAAQLGPNHPDALQSKNNLAFLYSKQRKYDQAETLYKEAIDGYTAQLGADHPSTLNTMNNLAGLYRDQGKYDRVETLFREVADSRKQKYGADSPGYADALFSLGLTLLLQQKFTDAEPILRECLAIREKKLPEDWSTFNARSMLGEALAGQQKNVEAERLLIQGYEGLKQREAKIVEIHKPRLLEAFVRLVRFYNATGKPDEAAKWRKEGAYVVGVYRKSFFDPAGTRGGDNHSPRARLGKGLLDAGLPAEAEPVLRECLAIREKQLPEDWRTCNARSLLGKALADQKKYPEAVPLLVQGYEGLKKMGAKVPADSFVHATDALEWLVQLYEAWGKPDEAAKWRKQLEETKAATKPPAKP